MNQQKDITDRTFNFAVRIINLCKVLDEKPGVGRVLYKQLIRSGTSIGANVEESQSAQSKADFVHKLEISLKEARETRYWLRIMITTEIIEASKLSSLLNENEELIKILAAIMVKWYEAAKDNLWDAIGEKFGGLINLQQYFSEQNFPLPNLWLGTSTENQAMADKRIPILMQIPAAIRFLSCEPLLEEIDFRQAGAFQRLISDDYEWELVNEDIHWIIVGGESGTNPPHYFSEAGEGKVFCRVLTGHPGSVGGTPKDYPIEDYPLKDAPLATPPAPPTQKSCVCETEQTKLTEQPRQPELEESTPKLSALLLKNSESSQQTDNPSRGSTIAAGSFEKSEQSNKPQLTCPYKTAQNVKELIDAWLTDPTAFADDFVPLVVREKIKWNRWVLPWHSGERKLNNCYQNFNPIVVDFLAAELAIRHLRKRSKPLCG